MPKAYAPEFFHRKWIEEMHEAGEIRGRTLSDLTLEVSRRHGTDILLFTTTRKYIQKLG